MNNADKKLNEKICKALGFERYTFKSNGKDVKAWKYPDRFSHIQCSSPSYELPNLLGLIEDGIKFSQKYDTGG